jgi:hypothetical protein
MAIGRQVGPAVLREYFAEDLPRISAEYDAFVRAIVARGNGEKIWRGESPLKAISAATPVTPGTANATPATAAPANSLAPSASSAATPNAPR